MEINSNDKSLEIALTIEHLIHQYGSYIYHLALKLSADPQKAEDLAQETFIKAWKHIGDIEKKEAVKKWLRTICINEFRMMYRSEKREEISYYESVEELEREGELLVSVTPLPEDENETAEEVAKLRDGCFRVHAGQGCHAENDETESSVFRLPSKKLHLSAPGKKENPILLSKHAHTASRPGMVCAGNRHNGRFL